MAGDRESHCYRVRLPSLAEARRIRGLPPMPERTVNGITYEGETEDPGPEVILRGAFGPPCYQCRGVSEYLCDFPIGEENRTCDRALCGTCAPPQPGDRNFCHDHDEHGRNMLLFPQPKRVIAPPGPAPRKRAKLLPRKPPESHRWRVRQGDHGHPPGAVLTGWMTQLEAMRFAEKVRGHVETWEEFVKLWRTLYPLAKRGGRNP